MFLGNIRKALLGHITAWMAHGSTMPSEKSHISNGFIGISSKGRFKRHWGSRENGELLLIGMDLFSGMMKMLKSYILVMIAQLCDYAKNY